MNKNENAVAAKKNEAKNETPIMLKNEDITFMPNDVPSTLPSCFGFFTNSKTSVASSPIFIIGIAKAVIEAA